MELNQIQKKKKEKAQIVLKEHVLIFGIGRELYTAPLIFIKKENDNYETEDNNGKQKIKTRFKVFAIEIKDKTITGLCIVNNKGKKVFTWRKDDRN